MSVSIVTTNAQPSMLQRMFGSAPRTIIKETSTTTITNDPGGRFNLKTALRNGGLGAAAAGVLGGVSLLAKTSLPLIGQVGTVAKLVRLIGMGGALGAATAAIPLLAPVVRESPAARAAAIGAGVGAAAGFVLPLVPTWLGAAAGAGVGLLVHARKNRPPAPYPQYPGYQAYPGWVAVPGFETLGLRPEPRTGVFNASSQQSRSVGAVPPQGVAAPAHTAAPIAQTQSTPTPAARTQAAPALAPVPVLTAVGTLTQPVASGSSNAPTNQAQVSAANSRPPGTPPSAVVKVKPVGGTPGLALPTPNEPAPIRAR